MNELERAVLNAIRACNHKMEMNQGTQRPLSNIKYGNENELLHYLKTLKINEDVSTLNAITQIETVLLGGKQTLGVNSARIAFDDTYFSPAKLQEIKNKLYGIYQTLNGIPHPSEILSDDELRNINSFEYLKNLQDLIPDYLQNKTGFDNVFRHCKSTDKYDINLPYGNFYTEFLLSLEKEISYQRKIRSNSLAAIKKYNNQSYTPYTIVQATNALNNANKKLESLENLIDTIYANHNFALERSYDVVKKEVRTVRQTNPRALQKKVKKRLQKRKAEKRKGNTVNKWRPSKADTLFKQARANFGDKFKPMMTTSQPSEVHLAYKSKQDPKQLRFGTQGQVYRYKTHINPIHEEWLRVQRRKRERSGNTDNNVIDHIYFNNLSRCGTKLEKRRETNITRKLEELERRHPNLAVITIPSDEGLMNHHFSKDRKLTEITTQDLYKKLLAIANGTSKDEFAGDFHLSDDKKARKKSQRQCCLLLKIQK